MEKIYTVFLTDNGLLSVNDYTGKPVVKLNITEGIKIIDASSAQIILVVNKKTIIGNHYRWRHPSY